ncbi:hypothetical protein [Catenovulum agarivorans]|uniref:hypothetical protein n=1 Tax=Catenovulum agarivorans TaxID=1172192 RepID=UPI0004B2C8DE|nr:hypothetical protein [Catenovulum agarivorans]
MAQTEVKKTQATKTFVPKMTNFEISSRYEGLTFKKENLSKSLEELKAKYAR